MFQGVRVRAADFGNASWFSGLRLRVPNFAEFLGSYGSVTSCDRTEE